MAVGAVAGVVFYYKNQMNNISRNLETERYSRLVAEEKVISSVSKIQQLQDELGENETKLEKIQELLTEQKDLNKDLEDQFQKLNKAKSQLEQEIQTLISQQAVAAQAEAAVQQIVQGNSVVLDNQIVVPAQ